ncbi:ATP-dependent DNA ligase [Microbacterium sp. 1.5R]|uniref:non-homologous end-joining DNA ligase n=1 Tax=Microbacterium TaxID=33882 RepID=UPI0006FF6BDB|nr:MULTISPECIES: non-homologous end-joining DNA ligase [unclassified Microbacterium]APH44279.1 ATP-dependent DNA ligase [Microbacterium sp. 1.5R]KRD54522.1 ATP-dependent DNA ligase [Microbacterium sp. Root280D1]MDY0985461.1 non-homologous end-joining DNA ligase [Microbacterium sp. CFBP9023]
MASERVTLTVIDPDGEREVALSSPNRVVWPKDGITKAELAEYFQLVSVPFLEANGNRPVSLERFRDGVGSDGFFSKNPPKGTPDYVDAVTVTYNSARRHPQIVLNRPSAIVWAAQMNTIVFHPWASLATDPDNPVELRIDLDPQPGTGFADAIPAAHALREVLEEVGLTAFVKTSGNRGLHVFAPIEPTHEFLDVRHAVIAAGRELERRMPEQVTMSWWKEERGQRVFIDFNQANRDRTMAGAYSPRALPGATVSTPVYWDELDGLDPAVFTVRSIPKRLAEVGDPWAGKQDEPGRIDTLLEWWERDKAAGLGELSFPPEFPKMPGEPPRVQPSKKVDAHWDANGDPVEE